MIQTKKIFIDGPIKPDFIAESISKHNTKKDIGGHNIFLGQVRNDIIEGKKVIAIDYTAYQEMAEKEIVNIREDVFENFDLTCLHIYHSIGRVNAGEISNGDIVIFAAFGAFSSSSSSSNSHREANSQSSLILSSLIFIPFATAL